MQFYWNLVKKTFETPKFNIFKDKLPKTSSKCPLQTSNIQKLQKKSKTQKQNRNIEFHKYQKKKNLFFTVRKSFLNKIFAKSKGNFLTNFVPNHIYSEKKFFFAPF